MEEVGALAGQPKCYGATEGLSCHPRGGKLQVLDKGGKIGDILTDAVLPAWLFAVTMPATVIGEYAERLRQVRNKPIPIPTG